MMKITDEKDMFVDIWLVHLYLHYRWLLSSFQFQVFFLSLQFYNNNNNFYSDTKNFTGFPIRKSKILIICNNNLYS